VWALHGDALLTGQELNMSRGAPAALHPYLWEYGGYYDTAVSYYNVPYLFGLLFGLGLYARYRQDPRSFRTRYDELLSSTGRADAATLAAQFGIDLRAPAFYVYRRRDDPRKVGWTPRPPARIEGGEMTAACGRRPTIMGWIYSLQVSCWDSACSTTSAMSSTRPTPWCAKYPSGCSRRERSAKGARRVGCSTLAGLAGSICPIVGASQQDKRDAAVQDAALSLEPEERAFCNEQEKARSSM
jgi:hypothetical protein